MKLSWISSDITMTVSSLLFNLNPTCRLLPWEVFVFTWCIRIFINRLPIIVCFAVHFYAKLLLNDCECSVMEESVSWYRIILIPLKKSGIHAKLSVLSVAGSIQLKCCMFGSIYLFTFSHHLGGIIWAPLKPVIAAMLSNSKTPGWCYSKNTASASCLLCTLYLIILSKVDLSNFEPGIHYCPLGGSLHWI